MNKPSHEYCKECKDWNGNRTNCFEICGIPIDIMEEWEKYRAIGTVEECRVSVEKQKAKKPIPYKPWDGKCPVCSVIFTSKLTNYCGNCGQRLDWSDEA